MTLREACGDDWVPVRPPHSNKAAGFALVISLQLCNYSNSFLYLCTRVLCNLITRITASTV